MSASAIKSIREFAAAHRKGGREQLAAQYDDMLTLLDRKLYHQLTVKSLELVRDPYFGQGNDELIKLYASFFKELEPKAKPLSMAQIAVATASQYKDGQEAIAFLRGKAADLKPASVDSYVLLMTMAANNYAAAQAYDEAKVILEELQAVLDASLGLDPIVYSQFYRVLAIFHKNQVHAAQFYRAGLLYLAHTSLETIPRETQTLLARDLALAGLTAPEVYGMGELLGQAVLDSLREDKDNGWLLPVVNAYNSGRIAEWSKLKEQFKAQFAQYNSLLLNLDMVEEKIAILALVELIWARPANGRSLSFKDIQQATHTSPDKVEWLVMRAMALGVVSGDIDQVEAMVHVTNVQPRVLSPQQIQETLTRVSEWKKHVQSVLAQVEQTELAH